MLTPANTNNIYQPSSVAQESVPDCVIFPAAHSRLTRIGLLAAAAIVGAGSSYGLAHVTSRPVALWTLVATMTFAGGLLSTWSPCGYSSLCLLRPHGRYSVASVVGWLPTFAMHGLGYAAGAVLLGTLLGLAGMVLGLSGFGTGALLGLAAIAVLYGIHQLDFLRIPYPQRRAQVPHDARQRFPMWVIGGLYGFALGLNYLTYVQTPVLYVVTAAAAVTGNVALAVAIFALFNLGRFLPIAVNLLPVTDVAVQDWLARRQEQAAAVDGALLVAAGFGFAALTLI